jgi:hypothetical protein
VPEETLGLLDVAEIEEVRRWDPGACQRALERIEGLLTLASGRVLRPASDQADMGGILGTVEGRAWASLRQFRFAEFGHWAELWASLAKASGETWRNPFSEVAAVGRKHRPSGPRKDGKEG